MDNKALDVLCQWEGQKAKALLEIEDLTGQLADAMARKDQVSVSMLLNLRQDPIGQAEELAEKARAYIGGLPEGDAPRAAELLNGAPAETEDEERLTLLVSQNREKLERIRETDKRLSLQLGGRHSFYEKFRQ